jgi:hydrogenase nickel incorporation protein HypB
MTDVDVRQRILAANAEAAAGLRQRLTTEGTLAVNVIGSPGAGKTTLVEALVRVLRTRCRIGALEGDIATERDADRLRALGIPARQIVTGGACHLDARVVRAKLEETGPNDLHGVELLIIENVGNLICPVPYDLGEDFQVAVLSVAEGDDKPFKYPALFAKAKVTVVTKADLLPYCAFDLDLVRRQVASLNPAGVLLVTSAVKGEGVERFTDLLLDRLAAKRAAAPEPAGQPRPS